MVLELISGILNAPLVTLIDFIKALLINPVQISLFYKLWSIIIYIFSFIYGLLLLWNGVMLMTSGHDVEKRNKAKEWLKNIIIMIILIQASYFLYETILTFNSLLTSGIFNFIDPSFLFINLDNGILQGLLGILLMTPYIAILLITCVVLVIRYVVVILGVVLLPIGIFCYFTPVLSDFGKFILYFLGLNIFSSFFASLALLVCSYLLNIDIFSNLSVFVAMAGFLVADFIIILFMAFSIFKAVAGSKHALISGLMK